MNKQNDNELITTLNNLLNSLNILDKKFNEYFKRTERQDMGLRMKII